MIAEIKVYKILPTFKKGGSSYALNTTWFKKVAY